jgi:serine palmitoyltransferase
MGLHVLGDWGSPISPILLYNPAKIAAFSREMLDHKVNHHFLLRSYPP